MTLIDELSVPVRLNEAHTDTNPIKIEECPYSRAQSGWKNPKAKARTSSARQDSKYLMPKQPCMSSRWRVAKVNGVLKDCIFPPALIYWTLTRLFCTCSGDFLLNFTRCSSLEGVTLQHSVLVFPPSSSSLHVNVLCQRNMSCVPPRLRALSLAASLQLSHWSPGTAHEAGCVLALQGVNNVHLYVMYCKLNVSRPIS